MAAQDIIVRPQEPGRFEVDVTDGATVNTFSVGVPEDLEAAGLPPAHPEALVEASFRFLLDRENTNEILSEFDLPDIAGYFPEYPEQVRRYLH